MTPYEFELMARKMIIDHSEFRVLVRNDFTTTDHAVQLIITTQWTLGVNEFVLLDSISPEKAELHIEHAINELEKKKNQLDMFLRRIR